MKATERFYESIRAAEDEVLEKASSLELVRQRLLTQRSAPPAKPARTWQMGFAFAGALCAALVAIWYVVLKPTSLTYVNLGTGLQGQVGAFIASSPTQDTTLRFSDGSTVIFRAKSIGRVLALSRQGAHLVVEDGHASLDIVHRADTSWALDVGPFAVDIIGTRFDVDWDAREKKFDLTLYQGSVRISGSFLTDSVTLKAGQRFSADASQRVVQLEDLTRESPAADNIVPEASASASTPAPSNSTAPLSTSVESHSSRPSTPWQTLANAGQYQDAMDLVEKAGFDSEMRRCSPKDLLLLADTARFSGRIDRATSAYTQGRTIPTISARSAFGLGQLAFDKKRDYNEAARWFQQYLNEVPDGALACEAMGRLMESTQRTGMKAKAREVAHTYRTKCPHGSYSELAEGLDL